MVTNVKSGFYGHRIFKRLPIFINACPWWLFCKMFLQGSKWTTLALQWRIVSFRDVGNFYWRRGIGLQTCWPTPVTLYTPPTLPPARPSSSLWWRHGSRLISAPRIYVFMARERAQSISEEHVYHWGNSPSNWVNGLLRFRSLYSLSCVSSWTCSVKHHKF